MIDERAVKFHTIANTLVAEQKYNEAITNFLKAVELQPDYDAAVYHLAETYEAKMLEEKAYEYYLKAININPSYAMTHIESGLDTLLSGPLGKAVAEFKKIKKIGGDDTEESGSAVAASGLDGPAAQKGLNPKKILVDGDTELESRVGSTDTISVRVLGDRDVPVLEAPVEFAIVFEDTRMADAALALKVELLQTAPQHKLTARTDTDGRATVFFRRSKAAGRNIVAISCGKAPGVRITDTTFAAGVASIDISPKDETFIAGADVTFNIRAIDSSGNSAVERDIVLNLLEREGTNWNVFDAATEKTDAEGNASHTFTMPTLSGIQCRLQAINKEADYTNKIDFKLTSSNLGSALFIPMKGKVGAGREFTLKVKLLDEYDNPVVGRRAKIVVKESSGGAWSLGSPSGETTDGSGSVWLMVTPPDAIGATAIFTVDAPGLSAEDASTASFRTVEAEKSDTVHAAGPRISPASGPDLDLDMELELPSDAGDSGLTPDFMAEALGTPKPPIEDEISGPGLDAIDYDAETPGFGTPASNESPEVTPAAAAGSALDALDSMLDDAPGAPSPITESQSPEPDDRLYDAESDGPGLLLPDDMGEPAAKLEYDPEPRHFEEDAGGDDRHDDFQAGSAPEGPDRIEVSATTLEGAAGDVVAVTAVVRDKNGKPVDKQYIAFMVKDTRGQGGYFEEPTYMATDGRGEAQATFVFDGNPGDETMVSVSHETVPESHIDILSMITAGESADVEELQPESEPLFEPETPAFEPELISYEPEPPAFEPPQVVAPPAFTPPIAPPAAAPTPPIPGPAPAAYTPPPAQQPPQYQQPAYQPPAPPTNYQDIQYQQNEVPMAPPTQAALQQHYGMQAQEFGADPSAAAYAPEPDEGLDYDNLTPEEIMALEDPYAVPQFQVKRGKKPPIEMEVLVPQIIRVLLAVVLVVGVVVGIYMAQENVRFLWTKQKADKLFAQEQLDAAVAYYQKCILISSTKVEPYIKLGEIYYNFAETEDNKGNARKKNHMLNQAADYLNQAISVQETNRDAHYNLCSVYEYQEKFTEAEAQCKRVLEIDSRFEAAAEKLNSIQADRKRGRR